jgi:Ca2+-binding EF-hand superfamily protein
MSLQLPNLFRFIVPATLFLAAGLRGDEPKPAANLIPSEEAMLQRFDTNGDGKLDETELADAHEALRVQPATRAALATQVYGRLLEHFGKNGAGRLDPEEQAAAVGYLRQNNPRIYQALLLRFDVNGDGQLDSVETAAMFGALAQVAAAQPARPLP